MEDALLFLAPLSHLVDPFPPSLPLSLDLAPSFLSQLVYLTQRHNSSEHARTRAHKRGE